MITPEQKKEIVKPVCPICNTQMRVDKYKGYYDEFNSWVCDCSDKDLEPYLDGTSKGAYA